MIYRVENLSFAYRRNSEPVLNRLNFTLEEGESVTVLGRNGAGKSTLFDCMLGLLKPDGGIIELGGKNLSDMKPKQIAALVGYVPQNHAPVYDYSVLEFVLMGCASQISLFSRPGKEEERRAEEAISQLGLEKLGDRPYTELSGGERQLASIARAVASRPSAILFDEPTAHLDAGNQMKTLRVIRKLSEQGFSVAITTHDPNHALMLGGRVVILYEDGHTETGPVRELLTEETLRNLYGEDIRICHLPEAGRDVCVFPGL